MSINSLRLPASGVALAALALVACQSQPVEQANAPTAPVVQKVAQTGPHPGEAVYKQYCGSCHDIPDVTKAPTRATLARMPAGAITNALIAGKMRMQAQPLSNAQISYVSDYLSETGAEDDKWLAAMQCPANRRTPRLDVAPTVSTYGFDPKNSRQLSYAQTGLKAGDLPNMEVAWTIGFPDAVSMRAQAAVVGSTLFLPVGESHNRLFAFDISDKAKPCLQWVWEGKRTLHTSASYGKRKDGLPIVVVGDIGGYTSAINARIGKFLWEAHTGFYDASTSTGTPVVIGDKVYAPSSQFEIMMAVSDAHVCCKIHGGVAAVDSMTGDIVWRGHTMEDAKPLKDRGDGQMLWGPAGAPIWNSPSVDVKRNRLYVGTGEANSFNADPATDALMSFDLTTGKKLWQHQATSNDVFNVGCQPGATAKNCAKDTVYRDVDFGASTILATQPGGKEIVLGGQKSGTVWAMDPDTGAVVWRTDIGTGGPNGGIHWGIAADETHVYAPISYPGNSIPSQVVPADLKPGLYALNLKDGSIDWKFEAKPDCTDARRKFVPRCTTLFGLSGAPTIIGDYVVTGGLDGRLYVVEKKTGKLTATYETAQDFKTLNGVPANGASIDNASIIAVNGLLIMNSGYGLFGQGAGNVMIAFRPKG